jgi:trimeric autotransporter adhesin
MPGDIGSGGIVEIHFPPGGTAGQALVKVDSVDYNATWSNAGVGGGAAISAAGNSVANGTVVFSNANGVSFGMAGSTVTASMQPGAGVAAMQVSNTTYTSGTVQFSNANGVTFGSSAGQAITASIAAVPTSYVSNINGSSGALSLNVGSSLSASSNASSITFGLASNITTALQSANANYLTSQSNQAWSGSNASSAFQTLSFSNANGVSWSNNAGQVQITHDLQYTSATSNITSNAVNTSVSRVAAINGSSGTMSFAVGSSLSASSNASTITFGLASNITTALQSAGAYLTTAAQSSVSNVSAISAATNNTGGGTATLSGGVSFSNANNVTFYTSAGNAIVASFSTSQSVQTQASGNLARTGVTTGATAGSQLAATLDTGGLSLGVPAWLTAAAGGGDGYNIVSMLSSTSGGGTLGATFSALSASIGLMAGSNITLSQTSNTINIIGPSPSAGSVNFSASANSSNLQAVVFANSNNITFGLTTGSQITASFSQSVQTQASGNVPRSGFTTNATAGAVLVGTLDTNGLNVGVPAWLTTAAQSSASNVSLVIAATNNTGGGTASLSGAVSFSNINNVTFYTSAGNAVVASFSTSQSVQTQASGNIPRTGFTTGATAGSQLAGTHDTAGLNLGVPAWITTYAAQSVQGQTLTVSAANTSYTVPNLSFSNANNVSFSLSNNSQLYATASFAQSVQTQASGDIARSGFTTGATAGSVLVGTLNSGGLSLGVPAWLTVAAGGGIAASLSGNSTSGGVGYSNITSGTMILAGGPNITLSQDGSRISISAPNPGAAAEANWVNLLGNNTAGNTTVSGSTLGFSGVNMTLSGTNNSQLVMSVPATSSLVGVNGISVSTGGSTISIINQPFTGSWWQPEVYGNTTPLTMANGTVYIRPFELDGYFDVMKINMFQSFNSSRSTGSFSASVSNASSSSGSGSWGLTGTVLIFSRIQTNPTGASFNSLISMYSNTYSLSAGYSASCSWNANVSSATNSVTTAYSIGFPGTIGSDGAVTYGNTGTTGTTSFSSTSTNQNSFSSSFQLTQVYSHFSGLRAIYMPAGSTLGTTALPPAEYWLGVLQSTTWGSTNMPSLGSCASMSDAGRLHFTASTNNFLEIGNSVAFTTSGIRPIFGSANVSSGTTGNLALSTFSSISSYASMWFALDGRSKP